MLNKKPIITVKEARKLLGKEHAEMSDKEIEKLIEDADEMAKMALKLAKEKLLKNRPELD